MLFTTYMPMTMPVIATTGSEIRPRIPGVWSVIVAIDADAAVCKFVHVAMWASYWAPAPSQSNRNRKHTTDVQIYRSAASLRGALETLARSRRLYRFSLYPYLDSSIQSSWPVLSSTNGA